MNNDDEIFKQKRSVRNHKYRTKILASDKAEDFLKKNKEVCKKWRDENKEKVQAYRDANQARVLARAKEKVECECGASVSRGCVSRHRDSKFHKLHMLEKSRAEENNN